jgi:transcriptional regulator with XRE-family HTH domain
LQVNIYTDYRHAIRRSILMGSASRPKPLRLAQKLLKIRSELGLSQNGMLAHLGETEELFRSSISSYERGIREPPLPILLKYARIAGIYVEVLIDDELDLPQQLPASPKSEGIRQRRSSSTKKQKTAGNQNI